jgi:glyoxylase-like metal-dependent hydrolase (beta-lactamase superfamily II)
VAHSDKLPVAESWFSRTPVDDSTTLLVEEHVDPLLRANIWHVRGRDRDLVIDTGLGISSARAALSDLLDKPVLAVATHRHIDHIGGMAEFEQRLMHPASHRRPEPEEDENGLRVLLPSTYPDELRDYLTNAGYPLPPVAIDALPYAGYDPADFEAEPVDPTATLKEGDGLDIGGRAFQVLDLPGHTPDSIGLWDEHNGVLFSGDAVYDGPLLDELPESSLPDYIETMKRLRDLPVRTIHPGHEPSFGRATLLEIIDRYLAWRDGASAP